MSRIKLTEAYLVRLVESVARKVLREMEEPSMSLVDFFKNNKDFIKKWDVDYVGPASFDKETKREKGANFPIRYGRFEMGVSVDEENEGGGYYVEFYYKGPYHCAKEEHNVSINDLLNVIDSGLKECIYEVGYRLEPEKGNPIMEMLENDPEFLEKYNINTYDIGQIEDVPGGVQFTASPRGQEVDVYIYPEDGQESFNVMYYSFGSGGNGRSKWYKEEDENVAPENLTIAMTKTINRIQNIIHHYEYEEDLKRWERKHEEGYYD